MKNNKMKLMIGLTAIALSASVFANTPHAVKDLYVIFASHATITGNKTALKLHMADSKIAYFTNRPFRDAGRVHAVNFVKAWTAGSNSFAVDNPNAAIVGVLTHKGISVDARAFISLSKPSYNSSENSLNFKITPLAATDNVKLGSYSDVTLFIDSQVCNPIDPTVGGCG